MKLTLTQIWAALCVVCTATVASAYTGGWNTEYVDGYGREVLFLGDNSDGSYRELIGTREWCRQSGSSYATMRSVVEQEYDQISWWVDADCGDVVRICVRNSYGRGACSSYLDGGWRWF